MLPEHDRSFAPESPVGRYWLLNCVGFRVDGAHRTIGVVETVGRGPDGGDMLGVRTSGILRKRLVFVRAERVGSIHPWEDTIVLSRRASPIGRGTRTGAASARAATARLGRGTRTGATTARAATARLESSVRPRVRTAGLASARGLRVAARHVAHETITFVQLLAALAALLAAKVRLHAPGMRGAVASASKTTLAILAAYGSLAVRYVRALSQAAAQAIEQRRRTPTEQHEPLATLDDHRAADWPLRHEAEAEPEVEAVEPQRRRRSG